jgi:hypothetical protein
MDVNAAFVFVCLKMSFRGLESPVNASTGLKMAGKTKHATKRGKNAMKGRWAATAMVHGLIFILVSF